MMSPQIAWHDPVFRAYFAIVFGALGLGGIVLAFIEFVLRKKLGAVWKTYRSWLVIAPLGLLFVFAGRIPLIAGVALLSIFAFREFSRAAGLNRDRWINALAHIGMLALAIAVARFAVDLFCLVCVSAIVLMLLLPILRNRAGGELQRVSLGAIGFLYLGALFGSLGFLAAMPDAYGFICFIIFATELCDIAAFTFGKLFGRHPLRSRISPDKTVAGALGALGLAFLLPWLLRFSFPAFGAQKLFLTGAIVGLGGQLGDLSISLIKRELGIKNMGDIIPGHGGVLDRIDSLILVAPAFVYLVWP